MLMDPFLGEIKIMSFAFAPRGWAQCNGQQMPINQNQALFSLLGTSFGGNGQTTFALPNMRDRVALHTSGGFTIGQGGGEANHAVVKPEMPAHIHMVTATNLSTSTTNAPTGTLLNSPPEKLYTPAAALVSLQPTTLSNTGGSQPHENQQPYTTLNFCIALQGIFPSRN
jgi:microcystin-dependent protein